MRVMFLCGFLALAACGGDDGGSSSAVDAALGAPREVVMDSKSLLVGEIAEAKLTGGAGDTATIMVTAPNATLDWNIHGHAGGSTQTVMEELGVMMVNYTFNPTAQAEWYLLLRNRDPNPMTVDVKIELYGDIQWSGWL